MFRGRIGREALARKGIVRKIGLETIYIYWVVKFYTVNLRRQKGLRDTERGVLALKFK